MQDTYSMGKVRSKRPKNATSTENPTLKWKVVESGGCEVAPIPEEFMSSAPIVSLGNQHEEGCDTKRRGYFEQRAQTLKKKDKRKLRQTNWLQKLEACREGKELTKAAIERQKTVVVGDMQPLAAALPVISQLVKKTRTHEKMSNVKKSCRANVLSEVEHFHRVLDHPSFKANPLDAISQHIRNSLAREHAQSRN